MREQFDTEELMEKVNHAAERSRALFDDLAANTAYEAGVTRASYGEGEHSGRTLGEHMRECGCDVDAVRRGPPFLTPAKINGYLELHIEQGPVLEHEGFPVGVVTSICGNSRLRDARCMGKYDHGGGTPQEHRKDAVIATAALVTKVDEGM